MDEPSTWHISAQKTGEKKVDQGTKFSQLFGGVSRVPTTDNALNINSYKVTNSLSSFLEEKLLCCLQLSNI